MTASIEVAIDAVEVDAAVAFWREALGYRVLYHREPYVVLGPPVDDPRPRLVVQRVDRLDLGKTPVHIDLRVDEPDNEVSRLVALGATVRWEVDDTERGGPRWTTLADPQGVLFCVCLARAPDPDRSKEVT